MKRISGFNYLGLALIAFAGLGIEILYALLLEPLLYHAQIGDWSTTQYIIHWLITCATWGAVIFLILRTSKKKYQYDPFMDGGTIKAWQWIVVAVLVVLSLVESYFNWNGFKIVKEFESKGLLKFVFSVSGIMLLRPACLH